MEVSPQRHHSLTSDAQTRGSTDPKYRNNPLKTFEAALRSDNELPAEPLTQPIEPTTVPL
jgi:hypothetical protein